MNLTASAEAVTIKGVTAVVAPNKSPKLLAPTSLLARNAVLNFIAEGWIFLVLVAAMPRLVAFWGETNFGLFSLAWVAIGYLSLLDIGVNRAATKFISEHLATQNLDAVRNLVGTSFVANLTLGLASGLVILLASPYLVHSAFKISGGLEREADLVFCAVAVAVPVLLVQGILRAILTSYQRFGWINGVNAITMTTQWGAAVWLAWRGHGVAVVVFATVVARLAGTVVYGRVLKRLLPGLRFLQIRELGGLAKLLRFGTWVSVSQVISPILVYLDRMLIASFVSLGAVTLYTVPYEAMTRLRLIPSSLATTLYPAFSERGLEGQQMELQKLYGRSVKYLLLIISPIIVFLITLGPDVLSLWMGKTFAQHTSVVVQILGFGVLLNCLAMIPYNALQALGRPDLTGKFHLFELPFYLALCLFLIPHWGITGAALANSIRVSIDAILLFWAAHNYCNCNLKSFLKSALLRVLVLTVPLTATLVGVRVLFGRSTAIQLLCGVLALGLYAAVAWAWLVDSDIKPRLAQMLALRVKESAL